MNNENKPTGSTTFFCFSPFVMISTFVIEIALMMFVLLKDRVSLIWRLGGLILGLLATFQLAEYAVCEGLGWSNVVWARIGFVAITMLPALGLHLIMTLAAVKNTLILKAAYLSAFIWFVLFVAYDIFDSIACTGNYVIFNMNDRFGGAYFAYYYLLLFGGMYIALRAARGSDNPRQKSALRSMVGGYLLFIVPATVVNFIKPETAQGLPSIMCGFALLFAFVLTFKVLPKTR